MANNSKKDTAKNARKNKKRHVVSTGFFYIKASDNNILVSVCDEKGNVLFQRSSGQMGFKGAKKSTPYAATVVIGSCVEEASLYAMSNAHVFLTDVGQASENAIRSINSNKINVLSISDMVSSAHGGCRARGQRKV